MGRPREHDERTAAALLDTAEHIVREGGLGALSVRRVADEVGTTTRAVYSLFGSKDGLVAGLGVRAFRFLHAGLDAVPVTDDPATDLVEAGLMFRRFATEHPVLFTIAMGQVGTPSPPWVEVRRVGSAALEALKVRLQRLDGAGRLGGRTVDGATFQFHALCEGLATLELRGSSLHPIGEVLWRQALGALVAGFAQPATVSHSS